MTKLDFLEKYGQEDEPYVCASCGNCTLVCPVFRDLKWESYGPRGKLHIVKSIIEGEGEFGEDFANKIFLCNLCEHCTSVCTTGISLDRFWEVVRAEVRQRGLMPRPAQFVLDSVKARGDIMWMGSADRLLWMEDIEDIVKDRILKPAKVAYYLGCNVSLKSQLHDVAKSMIKIMEYADVDYTLLADKEVCCGAPLGWAGNFEDINDMAEKNLETIRSLGVETVVFSCPSCIQTWMEYSNYLKDDNNIELLTASQFINRLTREERLKFDEQPMVTVTFHDPCISARVLKVTEEPREIIDDIPGVYNVELTPSKEHTRCCGSHGLLDVVEPVLSSRIAEMRLRDVTVTPATRVVTECPRCILGFDLAKFTTGYEMKVQDITQLVAESLFHKVEGGDTEE
ncbi:MAG: (Fe-S)-binding protein [Candidatus Thorarchaeota archaeon]|jgi:heterodisulfide reductase subunit D